MGQVYDCASNRHESEEINNELFGNKSKALNCEIDKYFYLSNNSDVYFKKSKRRPRRLKRRRKK